MKTLVHVSLCTLLAAVAFGQRGAVVSGGTRSGGMHFGGGAGFDPRHVTHGGFWPGAGPARYTGSYFARRYTGSVSFGTASYLPNSWYPMSGYPFSGYGYSDYWLNPSPYVWANPYPYTGYSGYGYGSGYNANPSVTVIMPYTPAPAPATLIMPERARPVMREYNELPAVGGTVIYLIAFKDQVIRPALAYWVEGPTLRYLDMDHKQREAPLGSLDRALSEQLNRERRVPFSVPEAQ